MCCNSWSGPQEDEVDPGVVEGTDLRVLKYPHPALRAPDEEVTEFDDDLKKTLKAKFLKRPCIVAVYSTYIRALTFENLW